MSSIDKK